MPYARGVGRYESRTLDNGRRTRKKGYLVCFLQRTAYQVSPEGRCWVSRLGREEKTHAEDFLRLDCIPAYEAYRQSRRRGSDCHLLGWFGSNT